MKLYLLEYAQFTKTVLLDDFVTVSEKANVLVTVWLQLHEAFIM